MKVDILLPTAGKFVKGLEYQVASILNQYYREIKLWVLLDCKNPCILRNYLASKFDDSRLKLITVPSAFSGAAGHKPLQFAIEFLPLNGEFMMTTGDDDCITPWGIGELVKQAEGKDMVVGLGVAATRQYTNAGVLMGRELRCGNVTGGACLYRTEKVKEVGYDPSTYEADWVLIFKLMENDNYITSKTIVTVMPTFFTEAA